jgi:hypothetical protein
VGGCHTIRRHPVGTPNGRAAEPADAGDLDLLVWGLDVEGLERAVLDGGRVSVGRAVETLLLVEDFVDQRNVDHLRADGWTLATLVAPYNGFWRRTAGPTAA